MHKITIHHDGFSRVLVAKEHEVAGIVHEQAILLADLRARSVAPGSWLMTPPELRVEPVSRDEGEALRAAAARADQAADTLMRCAGIMIDELAVLLAIEMALPDDRWSMLRDRLRAAAREALRSTAAWAGQP